MLALALDQAIRLALPSEPVADERWYLRTVRYHPVLGWSGYPGLDEMNDGIPVRTNSLGYRDREPAWEPDGQALEVLFLGDSFTWGDEVRREDRFTSRLEASCGSSCGSLPPIRAINQGIIGYGTAQSFLQYVLTRERRAVDHVILALFTGNDLTDNAVVESPSGPRPRLIRCDPARDAHALCLEGVPGAPVVDWPAHRLLDPRGGVARAFGWSGLVALASRRRAPEPIIERRIAAQMDESLDAVPFPVVERRSEAVVADPIGQLEAILAGLDRTVREDGRKFGVLVFPGAGAYAGDAGELRNYREALDVLRRLDIPVADYYASTGDAAWDDLFFGLHDHWRPAGHEEAAGLLRQLLVGLHATGESTGATAPATVSGSG
jgi:hypothetical protein